ncbi:MAG: hypothetical protein BEN19_04090 [Epulopiscium sp. Nuni2H_MBin003]|nr:MAG: hypothetical protein BEN19_04090 [Epulopiscium sp. Nuni2H_MBin003]
MKKVIIISLGIIGIIFLILIGISKYSWSDDITINSKANLLSSLELMQKQLTTKYPSTAEEVMFEYTELLRFQYTQKSDEEIIEQSIPLMRGFYAKELLALNAKERQIELLKEDVAKCQAEKNYLVDSRLVETDYPDDDTVFIIIEHNFVSGTLYKEYKLIKEEEEWKLYNWHDIVIPIIN